MAIATADLPTPAAPAGKAAWAGRILSGLVILFLLMDGSMKLVPLKIVIDASRDLAWPVDAATLRMLGALLLASTLLYALPRTSVLGAILITGYLGGAVATHARIGSPLFSHLLFGVYLGVAAWAGLWLREPRLRALLPLVR
ncbi:MAG: hypothetical protein QOH81_2726 [Sphingomonadales bacterium]|jgi:hypothetical protein|nr:hypothetical protein [Sphingomonadales bacterium]